MESEWIGGVYRRPRAEAGPRKAQQALNQLVEQEWAELPYIMMRITGAAASRNGRRFYWRDRSVHCGDIELNLIRSRSDDGLFTYTAVYSRERWSLEDPRRDLLIPLHPSFEDGQLRWCAEGISDTENLRSDDLAAVLLAKLLHLQHH